MIGPEVARRLAERRPGLAVLYVSAHSADDLTESGIIARGMTLLRKPFAREALVGKVRELRKSAS